MKKLFALLALTLCLSAKSQTIKWPYGVSTDISPGVGGTTSLTINNNMNHVGTIPTLTANLTINVIAAAGLKAGAILIITIKTTSTETTTFAGSIVSPVVTGVAGKTWSQAFIFNSINFYPCGSKIQID